MRRKYSIGFLVFTIIVIFLFIFVYQFSYHRALAKMEEDIIKEFTDLEECYYIKDTDGYVTVYLADKETVYEYTSILAEELPDEIQSELKNGKKMNTLGQVYGFLENYSS